MQVPEKIEAQLEDAGQQHLVRFWDGLSETQQQSLTDQIAAIDFKELAAIAGKASSENEAVANPAERAIPPQTVVRLPQTEGDLARLDEATRLGRQALAAGKVAAVLVAGGQGTRLGFPHPKGMFPVGPVSQNTLFQIFCEQLIARSERAGVTIPYLIMTSAATHDETVSFFESNDMFGLPPGSVHFFQQGSMPAVDSIPDEAGTHRVLMAGPGTIATSPDGHGGILTALKSSGLLDQVRANGVEHLYYHQVDNPTAIVCDPTCIGFHIQTESDMSTKVVEKVTPQEKMGVVVEVDGKTQIIEYSELTGDLASKTDADGNWIFWAGNTAMHVFRCDFLDQLTSSSDGLTFHVARKNVPYVDESGNAVKPDDPANPNAFKFERFIFDALPAASNALVLEASRAREFNPVKNREGADSPETAKAALVDIARNWLASNGHDIPANTTVEISPLFALEESDLAGKEIPKIGEEIYLS